MKVCVLLAPGFEEAEAIIPVDLLRRGKVEVETVGVYGVEVAGAHNIVVHADCAISEIDEESMDMLFVPGGLGGINGILESQEACDVIRRAAANDKYLAAICAGPTVLGRLGVIDGKKAVCYPGMEDLLAGAVHTPTPNVMEDGKLLTGEAAGSAFDLGLLMLEKLQGKKMADKVKHSVYYYGG